MNDRQEEVKKKSDLAKKTGFIEFMNNPSTRAMISMVPPMENRDILEALFQSCFEAGYNSGISSIMLDLIEQITKKDRKF